MTPDRAPDAPPVLETRELTIRFGAQTAVDAVSCIFRHGTLTALVGPNGAGKTTYLNLISGQLHPDSGRVLFEGTDITDLGPAQRTHLGIGRTFQLTNLYPRLSALENVRLAVQSMIGHGYDLHSIAGRERELVEEARRCLELVGLDGAAGTNAAALAHGDQRRLEVAILLALRPKVMLLDEPTSGMSFDQIPIFLELVERIARSKDKTILLVEHRMDVVERLADRIIVLQDGRLIADGPPAQVVASPAVQRAYLGAGHGAEGRVQAPGNPS
jgi:branched-chain amino acid transport system ATP-binding protein